MTDKHEKNREERKDNPTSKPDPETLHTTDPQENMKGPFSSTMQNIKKEAEKNDDVTKDEATRHRDERL